MSWVFTAIAVTAVSVVGTGVSAYQSYAATQDAKDQAKLLAKKEKANAAQAAMRLQKRRGVLGAEPGLRDTILTGPLGAVGTGNVGSEKTLLGA